MKQIINARIVLPDRIIEDGSIVFDDKIISITEEDAIALGADEIIDIKNQTVIPGLIDLHIHGYLGADASDGDVEGIIKMADGVAKNGVTAFLPTTMTLSYEELEAAFDSVRKAKKTGTPNGAEILGVHAEGPFINAKKCGAQRKDCIVKPDADFLIKHKDILRMVTIAPETDDNFEVIKKVAKETNIVLSAGHTDADFDTATAAIDAGITHATHLFNAMPALTHRGPGLIGAALNSDKVSCELICDTFHIHPALFKVISKVKGNKFNAITDCMRAGGLPDGEYSLGGQKVFVTGIKCLLEDGVIAGSVLKLDRAVYNLTKNGLSECEAVNAASLYPAMTLGLENERGSIAVGKKADLVICDRDFNVQSVFRSGKKIV